MSFEDDIFAELTSTRSPEVRILEDMPPEIAGVLAKLFSMREELERVTRLLYTTVNDRIDYYTNAANNAEDKSTRITMLEKALEVAKLGLEKISVMGDEGAGMQVSPDPEEMLSSLEVYRDKMLAQIAAAQAL